MTKKTAKSGTVPKYFVGLKAPRDEVDRTYDYGGKHPITFTKEVAETAVEGDLYFQRQSDGINRFYVPNPENSEELWIVTHVFNGYGWDAYDPHGNLVLPIYNHGGDLKYAGQRAIEQAIYDTPLGKALGRDALRPFAEQLATKFGLEWDGYEESGRDFHVKDDQDEAVREALKRLLEFRPESGYWEHLGKMGAACDGVGFAKDAKEYNAYINGESDGFGGEPHGKKGTPIPLMSQPILYAVAGSKDDGRSIWGRLERLMEAVGLEWKDVRE